MSEENEQLIRRAYALMNSDDTEGGKAIVDPECEFQSRFASLTGHAYRGRAGVEQWFADVNDTWDRHEQTPERFVEVDDERTVAVVRFRATGRGSGVAIDQEIGTIWSIRGGLVARVEAYATVDEALEAAGLSE